MDGSAPLSTTSLSKQQAAFTSISSSPSPIPTSSWPPFSSLQEVVSKADYTHVLACPFDFHREASSSSSSITTTTTTTTTTTSCSNPELHNATKILSPHGAVACCKIDYLPNSPYTGSFQSADHCLVRLSSSIQPPAATATGLMARAALYAIGTKLRTAELFPNCALKVFKDGATNPSSNLLFGAAKTGQSDPDFFKHCLSTNMTERCALPMRPVVNKFKQFSDYPLSLGVSNFARCGAGTDTDIAFPWAVVLQPIINTTEPWHKPGGNSNFVNQICAVPVNTPIYDMYACPAPSSATIGGKLLKLGTITTTSSFHHSGPTDGLFFKHQKKEEDYCVHPEWIREIEQSCTPDCGVTVGTVRQLAGWELFEGMIQRGEYVFPNGGAESDYGQYGGSTNRKRRGQREKR
jgi:hypothetical protein